MKDKFLSNNTQPNFLNELKRNLSKCNSFYFSISFIKKAGLILIEKDIEEALKKGARGMIITSTYQNFTDIPSLEYFLKLSNKYPLFNIHIDHLSFADSGFHTKGYIFEYDQGYEVIIGSTNITRYALLKNKEWNILVSSKKEFSSYIDSKTEFLNLWNQTHPLSEDIISNYKMQLEYAIEKWDMDYFEKDDTIKPNRMQKKALKELRRYRDLGVKKSLIVSATASGKTYLSAFDVQNYQARRMLFIVHRESILIDAMKSYEKIFSSSFSYGLYTGSKKENADFLFTTVSMMSKNLENFSKDEFDYIVADECHHATSQTYKSILEYFNPGFLLGLTATPERMDNADVFSMFDKNVPYELRLRDSIIYNLVVPFKYYGIRDKIVDYSDGDINNFIASSTDSIHASFIKTQIEKHKEEEQKLKCIAFCKNIEHSTKMAESLSNQGYNTRVLTGTNKTVERIIAFRDLQDENHPLEIICTVDILNEGVDIPGINMVLFLRPTDSSTIFLQQLGRGLRKYPNKTFLTVLDFIGNSYKRSVQIAMALSRLSKNQIIEKKLLQTLIREDFKSLELPVEIHIDALSKEEILKYIEKTNFNKIASLKSDYYSFKKYLGTSIYPSHMDFLNVDNAPDLLRLIKSQYRGKNRSYYSFLSKIEEDTIPYFTSQEVEFINNLSDLLPCVRPHEFLIIKYLLKTNNQVTKEDIINHFSYLKEKEKMNHAIKILFNKKLLIKEENCIILNCIINKKVFIDHIHDIINYGLEREKIEYGEYEGIFKKYGNYYKSQIMMMLLENGLMFVKGTKFLNNNTYVFVGIKKDKQKQVKHNYMDKFISNNVFQWESENNTTIDNKTGLKLDRTKKVFLFVRKMDSEDGITLPFTFLGTGKFTNKRVSNNPNKTLLYDILLDEPIPQYLYSDFEVYDD